MKKLILLAALSTSPAFSQEMMVEDPTVDPMGYSSMMTEAERTDAFNSLVESLKTDPNYAGTDVRVRLGSAEWTRIDRTSENLSAALGKSKTPTPTISDKIISLLAKDVSARGDFHMQVKINEIDENGKPRSVEINLDAGAEWAVQNASAMKEVQDKYHR